MSTSTDTETKSGQNVRVWMDG
ncbi:unnamed protein product, partial [Rotaria socialis]